MRRLLTCLPVLAIEDTLVVMAVGAPQANVGDSVEIVATAEHPPQRLQRLTVTEAVCAPLSAHSPNLLRLFRYQDTEELQQAVEAAYAMGFRPDHLLTVYVCASTE